MSGSYVSTTAAPVAIKAPTNAKGVTVSVSASGGVMNVSWFVSLDGGTPESPGPNAIPVVWDAGEVADGATEARTFVGSLEAIQINGDGTANVRFQY
jgi:hypothetical protein